MVLTITDENFEEVVQKASLPVLVDFYADWCGPCRMMSPVVENMAERFEGRLLVGKLNVDENPKTALQFQVRSIPYVALFQAGEIADFMLGAGPEEELAEMIERKIEGEGQGNG